MEFALANEILAKVSQTEVCEMYLFCWGLPSYAPAFYPKKNMLQGRAERIRPETQFTAWHLSWPRLDGVDRHICEPKNEWLVF